MSKIQTLLKRLRFNWVYIRNDPPWDAGIPAPELVDFVAGRPAGRALDLGCGTGTHLLYLVQQGWQVDGVDFSRLAICRARQKMSIAKSSANLLVGDVTHLERLPLRTPFDLTLDIGCLHALGAERAANDYSCGLRLMLKPGGYFMLYAHQPSQIGAGYPAHGLTLEWVNKLFGQGFQLLDYRPGKENRRASAWYWLQRSRD